MSKSARGIAIYVLGCAALALCVIVPWCSLVALGAIAALVAEMWADHVAGVKEARIAALEESFEKLKATAAAVVKVEARTSALERGVAAALRMEHD